MVDKLPKSDIASGLRVLVAHLERACAASKVNSIAHPIVSNACSHLSAIALNHDLTNVVWGADQTEKEGSKP